MKNHSIKFKIEDSVKTIQSNFDSKTASLPGRADAPVWGQASACIFHFVSYIVIVFPLGRFDRFTASGRRMKMDSDK